MDRSPFADNLKLAPYWWDRTPRPALPETPPPVRADVLVIGSGFTGLSAGIETARGGRETIVLDAEDAGFGCSTRNGGQISTSIKASFAELSRRHGAKHAARILAEGKNSLAWVGEFVARERIDCDFAVAGRFHAAHTQGRFEALARKIAAEPGDIAAEAHIVPRSEQWRELGTDAYFGGLLYPRHASIDPGRFHQGMLERALAAGVRVVAHCPATAISRDGRRFAVATRLARDRRRWSNRRRESLAQTSSETRVGLHSQPDTGRGKIDARTVVIATNGYTGRLTPWLRRRVIPIGSYIIATEPIPPELMTRLMPKGRVVSDTRRVVYYYRPSPDGKRILFGGRVSSNETNPRVSGPRLHAEMIRIFPELVQIRISHSWFGFIAYTFDELMHVGERHGLHYAMGYRGSGVGMAGYLGMRVGQQVLERPEGATAFDDIGFQTRPFYGGNPWFLAASVMYYRWRDRHA